MNFQDYVTALCSLFEFPLSNPFVPAAPSLDPNFNAILPRIIEAGEQRIYRDLDLLGTRLTDATGTLTANSRLFTYPTDQGTYIVVEQLNVLVAAGQRQALTPVSREMLDTLWPNDAAPSNPSVPTLFAPYDAAHALVGPAPASGYAVETVGTVRPPPMSATNTTTFLATLLPDLFLVASCAFTAAYQRDFGAQSDNPQMAMSWETVYNSLKSGASTEEWRKKFQANGWSNRLPSAIATPPQT